MSTVFVVQDNPKLSYQDARKYGTRLIAVFPPREQVELSPQYALAQARKVLDAMQPGDSLVLVGDPVMIGICVNVAAEKIGKVRLLRWDKRDFTYIPVEVDFLDRVAVV